MDKLEELRRKRKEIDDEIKKIINADFYQVGNVKFDKDHYPTNRPDEFYVAVHCEIPDSGKLVWRSVVRNTDKQKAIDGIPDVIENLKELYDALVTS